MISNVTSNGPWSGDAIAGLAAGIARDDVSTATGTPRNVELTSVDAWTELIREIVATANRGGGRLVVRCIPGDESANPINPVFSVPIESTAGLKPTEPKPGTKSTAPA